MNRRPSPILALMLLGPLFGELISAHQSLFEFLNPVSFVITALPYGLGAIVCRELYVRWGKGWPSLILLGLAYGIYEEALVARSVWDPEWAELGPLREYTYWKGVVWTWTAGLLHFHATISIFCSVKVAEMLYPTERRRSWATNRQMMWCGAGLLLWSPVLFAVNPFVPDVWQLSVAILAAALCVALAYLLPARPFARRSPRLTSPAFYALIAAINMTTIFVVVFALPESDPSWLPAWPVTLAFVVGFDILTLFILIWRWGDGSLADDRHLLALVFGMAAFFLLANLLRDFEEGFGGSILVTPVVCYLAWKLWQRVSLTGAGGTVREVTL